MSEVFGDYEAEDAWDTSDDFSTHVDNLLERLAQLDGLDFEHGTRTRAHLEEVEARLAPWRMRRNEVDEHTRERIAELEEDLARLRSESP